MAFANVVDERASRLIAALSLLALLSIVGCSPAADPGEQLVAALQARGLAPPVIAADASYDVVTTRPSPLFTSSAGIESASVLAAGTALRVSGLDGLDRVQVIGEVDAGGWVFAGDLKLAEPLYHPVAPVSECDELAAHPLAIERLVDGVIFAGLRQFAAVRACRLALDAHPDEPRFQYQRGRALVRLEPGNVVGITHYIRAFEGGYPLAATDIGTSYAYGQFRAPDPELGRAFWLLGALAGDSRAPIEFAIWRLVPPIDNAAAQLAHDWLERAADLDYVYALVRLGDLYRCGIGVERDVERALELYQAAAMSKTADDGPLRAMRLLSELYENGIDVAVDRSKSAEWRAQLETSPIPGAILVQESPRICPD